MNQLRIKNRLIFFTEQYPFGNIEQFIEAEIPYLAEVFDDIVILPFKCQDRRHVRSVPPRMSVLPPLIPNSRFALILKGVFNRSPVRPIWREFREKRVYRRLPRLKSWLEHSLWIRHLLVHPVVRKLIKKGTERSLCYFYWGTGAACLALFLAAGSSLPTVARFHRSDLYEELNGGYIPFRDSLLRSLDAVVCISRHGLDYLRHRYPRIPFEGRLFRLGVPDRGLSISSEDGVLRIVSCSHLIPVKRIPLFINALSQLRFPVEWTHIGGGMDEAYIRSRAALLPANVQSRFPGYISNTEVLEFYLREPVDLFVNVSSSEGVPVSIMEALAVGIPVLATDVGGVSEIVDNTVGTLLPADVNSTAIAQEIKSFHALSREDRDRLRTRARDRWKTMCDADRVYGEFARFLEEMSSHSLQGPI